MPRCVVSESLAFLPLVGQSLCGTPLVGAFRCRSSAAMIVTVGLSSESRLSSAPSPRIASPMIEHSCRAGGR
eukprot:1994345-Prymnesium_polylepis.1